MRIIHHLSCLLAIAAAATLVQPTAAVAQDKAPSINIGMVDMERVFSEFYKTKDAEAEVEAVKQQIAKEVETRREKHKKTLDEFQTLLKNANDPTLSEALRKKNVAAAKEKENELKTLDAEMKEYAEKRRKQLITQVEDSKARILNEISKKINGIASADGFDVVFDSSGLSDRGFPFVVFVKDATDINEKVITALNADAPKAATP